MTEAEWITVGAIGFLLLVLAAFYSLQRAGVTSFKKSWKRVPKRLRQLIVLVIGATLNLIGLILIVLPGPFTMPFVIAGLVILAAEFAWAERILERTKHHARKIVPKKMRRKG